MQQPSSHPRQQPGARNRALRTRFARPWRERPSARALLAAAAFVLGLFVGGIVVGFAVSGPAPPAPRVTVTKAAPAPVHASSGALTGRAMVNAACLQAINDSQSSYAGVQKLIDALRSLNATRVDHAIMNLQPVREQLQRELHTCRVLASVPSTAPGTGTVAPSPTGSR